MEGEKVSKALVFMCCCVLVGMVHEQVLIIPAMARSLQGAFDGQKDYYSPDPHHSPSHSPAAPSSPTTAPSHGSSPSYGGTTPSSPDGGSGYYHNPPSSPTYSGPPTVPDTPTPLVPVTPITGTPPTPFSPITGTPPTPFLPLVPTPPSTPTPFDPNVPPFFTGTCNFWRTHPGAIWSLFGYWCNVGPAFGIGTGSPLGHDMSLSEALANTRSDGIGALYREGTASLLNSMVNPRFPFTTQQVRDAFVAALRSGDRSAAAQAKLFKKANEGHLKH